MNNKNSLKRETAAGRNNQVREGAARILFLAAACVSILAVLLITVFLLVSGVPAIAKIGVFQFLFGTVWKPGNDIYGILPMILGSIYVTAGALVLGVPIGVLTAIFLSRFASKRVVSLVKPAVQLLAGIPSVVYGFFGLVVIVPMLGGRGSMLAASIVLAIMILPTVITVSESSLNAVDASYYEGALALGATHERSVFSIILPAAKSGVTAAVILGIGRAIGEAMAVIMVAGNQPRMPQGILKGLRTLTTNIVMEMGYSADLHREALIATAVVLFVFILIINFLFSLTKRGNKA
ncbi:MAG: phosphate ABC transporter permease subunit PstC [Eubacteriales bacterium]|nr:phosphate ABC transporter permease subunit PstC [Eubacteriales bacterium]